MKLVCTDFNVWGAGFFPQRERRGPGYSSSGESNCRLDDDDDVYDDDDDDGEEIALSIHALGARMLFQKSMRQTDLWSIQPPLLHLSFVSSQTSSVIKPPKDHAWPSYSPPGSVSRRNTI